MRNLYVWINEGEPRAGTFAEFGRDCEFADHADVSCIGLWEVQHGVMVRSASLKIRHDGELITLSANGESYSYTLR